MKRLVTILAFAMTLSGLALAQDEMQVTSPEFQPDAWMPAQNTCDGKNHSPLLRWSAAPEAAQSLAVVMSDSDAPGGKFVHWVLFNLPPSIDYLPAAIPALHQLANGEQQGLNEFGKLGYGGPCPPAGNPHHYHFTVYALDHVLPVRAGAPHAEIEQAMDGHVLASGTLTGQYKRE